MSLKVLKFGGTSVANAENIKLVKEIAREASEKEKIAVVVSALGGVTDLLLQTAQLASAQDENYREKLQHIEDRHIDTIRDLIPPGAQSKVLAQVKKSLNDLETLLDGAFMIGETTAKLLDKIVSYGELLSSFIINEYFVSEALDSIRKDSRFLIKTNEDYGKASVDFRATAELCENYFGTVTYRIIVVPGFVASSGNRNTTTLGRGGSDYSAAIIAAVIEASSLEIWTDVSGMYTANPKWVKQAFAIPNISYKEALELSHFGAKVLYPPTVQPVLDKEIPIRIKNTFKPSEEGTLITKSSNGKNKPVRGISHINNVGLLSLEGTGMIGVPGVSKRLFEALSHAGISVILITQASSEHSICLGISNDEIENARDIIDEVFAFEISLGKIKPCTIEKKLAVIALGRR